MRTRTALGGLSLIAMLLTGCGGGESDQGPDAGLTFGLADEGATGAVNPANGGSVAVESADGTRFSLDVPPGAVTERVDITLTPLLDVSGLGSGDAAVHGVQLEPDGLEFVTPVRLTIEPTAPIDVEEQLMFTAGGDGSWPTSALIDPREDGIVLVLEHFSTAGVAQVTEAQRRTFREKSAANAESRLLGDMAEALQDERARQLLGEEPQTDEREQIDLITDEFEREVLAQRKANAKESCTSLATYLRSVVRWERARQLAGLSAAAEQASQQRIADASAFAQSRFETCEKEAIRACRAARKTTPLDQFYADMAMVVDPSRTKRLCLEQDYRIDTLQRGSEMNVSYSLRYTGVKCGGAGGTWELDSAGSLSAYGGTAEIGGPVTVRLPEEGGRGTFEGTAQFSGPISNTTGNFTGVATFDEESGTLQLDVTSGSGNGYIYGFTDRLTTPGSLTLKVEAGEFCQ